jgi:Ca2+-binding EF-hand superfamily protein
MRRVLPIFAIAAAIAVLPSLVMAQEVKGPPVGRPNPEVLFQRLDANKDGQITMEEVPAPIKERFEGLVKRADKNGDKKISLEEFKAAHRGPDGPGERHPGEGFHRGPGGPGFGPGGPGFGPGGPGFGPGGPGMGPHRPMIGKGGPEGVRPGKPGPGKPGPFAVQGHRRGSGVKGKGRPNAEEIFKRLDTNGDKQLSLDEFKAGMKKLHARKMRQGRPGQFVKRGPGRPGPALVANRGPMRGRPGMKGPGPQGPKHLAMRVGPGPMGVRGPGRPGPMMRGPGGPEPNRAALYHLAQYHLAMYQFLGGKLTPGIVGPGGPGLGGPMLPCPGMKGPGPGGPKPPCPAMKGPGPRGPKSPCAAKRVPGPGGRRVLAMGIPGGPKPPFAMHGGPEKRGPGGPPFGMMFGMHRPGQPGAMLSHAAVLGRITKVANAIFDKIDANKDGKINAEEAAAAHKKAFECALARVDTDHDRAISKKEAAVALVGLVKRFHAAHAGMMKGVGGCPCMKGGKPGKCPCPGPCPCMKGKKPGECPCAKGGPGACPMMKGKKPGECPCAKGKSPGPRPTKKDKGAVKKGHHEHEDKD